MKAVKNDLELESEHDSTVSFVSDARRSRAAPPRQKLKRSAIVDEELIKEALSAGARHSSLYILDIFIQAVRLMCMPLSAMLFLWMMAFGMTRLSGALYTAFVPICYLPLVLSTTLCAAPHPNVSHIPKWADFLQLMQVQSSMFEQLLDGSVGGSGLLNLQTSDLITLVRYSDLQSNGILADLLMAFANDAKKTAQGLAKLSLKVGGAVDNAMAVNGYAMRIIQDVGNNPLPPHSLMALASFHTGLSMQEVIIDAFTTTTDAFSISIERLILEAEISLHNLDVLEEDLPAVRDAVACEDVSITAEKIELLGTILLKGLSYFWKHAHAHVVTALQTLNLMNKDIEDLRERVAAPELVHGHIPLHVHIESIQNGLQQLQEGRVRAKEREEEMISSAMRLGW
ncbi:hypothetical protein EDB19DRAFT_2011936 [Suillus lakei]|nr:hypothetical protein EDB19DRAFT_2011936 [Suillus lakei]